MWESLQTGFTKLLKYWNKTDRSPAYIAAIVLDPTVKWQYFDTWDPQWRPDMKSTMKQFWETQYRSSTGLSSYSPTTQTPPITKTQNRCFEWKERQRRLQSTVNAQSALSTGLLAEAYATFPTSFAIKDGHRHPFYSCYVCGTGASVFRC